MIGQQFTRYFGKHTKHTDKFIHDIYLRLAAMSRQLSSREEEFKQLRDAHSKLQKVRIF